MAALENGIGSFTAQLDVWTAHTRDLLTPCLVSVVSSFALMGNDPLVAEQQKLLAAMSEQLDTVHREVLGMRHMASTRTEGAHEFPKLRALLASPVQRSYFRDFLVANHRQENLDFYVASTKFCDDFLPLCEPDVASTLNVRARRLTVKDARLRVLVSPSSPGPLTRSWQGFVCRGRAAGAQAGRERFASAHRQRFCHYRSFHLRQCARAHQYSRVHGQ